MLAIYTKIKHYLFLALLGFFVPAVAFAAPANLKEFAGLVVKIMQNIIGVLFASLAIGLVYGVMLYLANSDNEKKRAEIKDYLLWGVIGIIVVMGLWGILGILRESVFGISTVGIPEISAPQQ